MNTLLVGINSKYIHPNMAIRLLKANAKQPVAIKEWTIKDSITSMVDYILHEEVDLLGLSCYIWNTELIKSLLTALRQQAFQGQILLGGPEVSYDTEVYFTTYHVDFIIAGEGEQAFSSLLEALVHNTSLDGIPNLHTKDHRSSSMVISDLGSLASPFFDLDYQHQIMYLEASRGCPFHCSYCMASLDNQVRIFPLEQVQATIQFLLEQGARTFKFLDRTFNLNLARTKALFAFIIEHAPQDASFQFEITGELLNNELINFVNTLVPPHMFRFEIGIQSTNDDTNRLIGRRQNNTILFHNISLLQEAGIVDVHLDLIAGLPREDLASFRNTFDQVIGLNPLELQLGFLKLLKGTKLAQEAHLYSYEWSTVSPYEIITNDSLSLHDLAVIHTVENVCDKYYNASFMKTSIHYLLDHVQSPFDFFYQFGCYYEARYEWIGYNLDHLFSRLHEYVQSQTSIDANEVLFLMKQDYLKHFTIKPKIWWKRPAPLTYKAKIKKLLETELSYFSPDDVYRYGIVETHCNHGFLILYKPQDTRFITW